MIIPDVASKPGLEDKHRPGISTACAKSSPGCSICAIRPAAVFGEKDWQQLQCVRTMSKLQGRELQIIPAETVREPSGLAMSSRNLNLTPDARSLSIAISKALFASSSVQTPELAESLMQEVLAGAGIDPEYAVVRPADTLMPLGDPSTNPHVPCRSLIAAKVGASA